MTISRPLSDLSGYFHVEQPRLNQLPPPLPPKPLPAPPSRYNPFAADVPEERPAPGYTLTRAIVLSGLVTILSALLTSLYLLDFSFTWSYGDQALRYAAENGVGYYDQLLEYTDDAHELYQEFEINLVARIEGKPIRRRPTQAEPNQPVENSDNEITFAPDESEPLLSTESKETSPTSAAPAKSVTLVCHGWNPKEKRYGLYFDDYTYRQVIKCSDNKVYLSPQTNGREPAVIPYQPH